MIKAFVTGGTGFLGGRLIKMLVNRGWSGPRPAPVRRLTGRNWRRWCRAGAWRPRQR